MKKAILVIDMPKNCDECPLLTCDEQIYCDFIKGAGLPVIRKEIRIARRHIDCPLKPMPLKREFADESKIYKAGWNDCLKEIIGKDGSDQED